MKFNSLLREESVLSGLILVVILLFSWPAAAIDSDIPKEYMYMMIAVLFLYPRTSAFLNTELILNHPPE